MMYKQALGFVSTLTVLLGECVCKCNQHEL